MNAGDVVLLDFPYSDLSGSKLRPAVVLATVGRDDFIACQVTSQTGNDPNVVPLSPQDFSAGGLNLASYARPGKLFTAHRKIVVKRVARITDAVKQRIVELLIEIVRRGRT